MVGQKLGKNFHFVLVNSKLNIEFALNKGHKVKIYVSICKNLSPFLIDLLNTDNSRFKEQIRF
jgi:hypothetical protein